MAFLAILFGDAIFASLAAILLLFVAFSALDGLKKNSKEVNFIPTRKIYRAIAGEKVRVTFKVETTEKMENISIPGFEELSLESRLDDMIAFEGRIQLAGIREINCINAEIKTFFGLFLVKRFHSIEKVQLVIYPRFVVPLTRLFGYEIIELYEGGNFFKISSYGEYASTRDYYPGDEIKYIDWKATARLQTLMVKEFASSYSGKVNLIFDATASDAVSADKLATEFFNTLLDLANSETAISASLYDGVHFSTIKARNAIEEIAEASLKMLGKFIPDIGKILDLPMLKHYHAQSSFAVQNFDFSGSAIVITQLLSNLIDKLLLVSLPNASGNASLQQNLSIAFIVQPTLPWLSMDSLEDAYLAKKEIERKAETLERLGIKVVKYSYTR